MKERRVITSSDVRLLLLKKYELDSGSMARSTASHRHAMFFELNNGTGWHGGRNFLDAFLLDLWPSGSFTRRVFEIKVSRSDFLSEIKNPNKRKWGMEISNEFWFVCAPDICKPEEVPEACGLMVVTKKGDKLRVVKHPTYREARELKMPEMMAMTRQMSPYERNADIKWLYQNQELTESAIDELVRSRIDKHVSLRISEGIRDGVKKGMENIRESMRIYAEAMKSAGIKPPYWMEEDRYGNFGVNVARQWSASNWVRENVSRPPEVEKIEVAKSKMETMQKHLQDLIDEINKLLEMNRDRNGEEENAKY